jgi:hypothetical protein
MSKDSDFLSVDRGAARCGVQRQSKHFPSRGDNRGVALVLVLGFIVLVTVLVLAFFTTVSTELVGAKATAAGMSARQLAASAAQIVQGTITGATEPRTDTTFAWASQPGMIRTYGTGSSASDQPLAYYKLYSSNNMVVTKDEIPSFSFDKDLDSGWNTKPALFTDLNAPKVDPNTSELVFPIADPRAAEPATKVQGFDITSNVVNGTVTGAGDSDRLPMPVRWIYVLRDGSLTAPTTGDAESASWSGGSAPVPTRENPIVGRIAFWTDDETSKVNINTASEGTYWDTPVTNTSGSFSGNDGSGSLNGISEWDLAYKQGAQKEFQRYPGHPATTSLSPIFGTLLGSLDRKALVKAITDAVPRVSDDGGSSEGGTVRATGILQPDYDRLYASVDEFAFKPDSTGSVRTDQALGSSSTDTRDLIERSRFFLTANSKSPELNLFGLPRIAIWPITVAGSGDPATDISKQTTFDKAIVRCATVANNAGPGKRHQMIFVRKDPASPTIDFRIPRNQQLYGYLKALTSRPIPGFGRSFLTKYGQADRDQILTEIFDYVRSTNLADTSEGTSKSYTPTQTASTNPVTKRGQVVPTIPPSGSLGEGTRGFGRFPTISELGFVLVKTDYRANHTDASGITDGVITDAAKIAKSITVTGGGLSGSYNPQQKTVVEWTLIPKLFCPMAGFSAMANNLEIRFTEIDLTIDGVKAQVGSAAGFAIPKLYDIGRLGAAPRDSKIGGNVGLETFVEVPTPGNPGAPADSMYPTGVVLLNRPATSTDPIPVVGTIKAEIWSPATGQGTPELIQTFNFSIDTEMPLPRLYFVSTGYGNTFRESTYTTSPASGGRNGTFRYNSNPAMPKGYRRIAQLTNNQQRFTYFTGDNLDSIRSLTPTAPGVEGDTRLVSLMGDVPASVFTLTKKKVGTSFALPTGSDRQVHSLRMGLRYVVSNAEFGKLANIPANMDYPSEVPAGITEATGAGDWDNGEGLLQSGPYINKADEGNEPNNVTANYVPYIGGYWFTETSDVQSNTFFSPNRQMPSAVMFGSLPTRVNAKNPWQTLLFRPAKLLSATPHPGGADPKIPDHLILDLFWMPVVEPYVISEPLASSGKINLNYQIAPFTYIKRDTGMRAVLKSTMITALPSDNSTFVKNISTGGPGVNAGVQTRWAINMDETLKQFDERFARTTHSAALPNFFVSASEICDVPLIPDNGTTAEGIQGFWQTHQLTGDNSLERPYAMIYPRVTTQSNTFTVHVRAQSLVKSTADPAQNTWKENRDQVTGEYRGSFIIEKYFDPNEANILDASGGVQPDASDQNVAATSAIRGTRWRLVGTKQFGQ